MSVDRRVRAAERLMTHLPARHSLEVAAMDRVLYRDIVPYEAPIR